jgi:hypothetical protein
MPEDDASALKIICVIIHHQNIMVPQNLTAGDILDIAITADKYECVECLKFVSGNWFQLRKTEDLMIISAAAYLF